jgi:hypothetical protein
MLPVLSPSSASASASATYFRFFVDDRADDEAVLLLLPMLMISFGVRSGAGPAIRRCRGFRLCEAPLFPAASGDSGCTACEKRLFEPFILYKNEHFAKTGSGQT